MDGIDKWGIIASAATEKMVETIIANIAGTQDEDLKDLSQEIYIDLLKKDDEKIEDMYYDGTLRYFITRMILNNVNSKNSRWYYTWKKDLKNRLPLDGINI